MQSNEHDGVTERSTITLSRRREYYEWHIHYVAGSEPPAIDAIAEIDAELRRRYAPDLEAQLEASLAAKGVEAPPPRRA